MMKRFAFAALVMYAAFGFGASAEIHDDENAKRRRFSFALIGDLQYNTAEETTSFPNLKADIDAKRLAFVVHDGDFHSRYSLPR